MATTHLHFDCAFGISGDMILGALVDLGVSLDELAARLERLPIGPFRLVAESVMSQGIAARRVRVEVEEDEKPHRHLRHVLEILDTAALPPRAAERAAEAYRRLAAAEARVHGSTPEKIHFHEVGAKDAILDIAGAMVGVELLGVESFSHSPVTVGSGTVHCRHGLMPVPAPATAELLEGIPHTPGNFPGDPPGELATPTGICILSVLAGGNPAPPDLTVRRIGYGSGTKEFETHPNYLRLMLCEALAARAALPVERHDVLVLETEIDDMSPEIAGYLMDRLLADGAWDVQFQAVQMKKNRPALRLRVLSDPARELELAERILRETSTFGLRRQVMERWCLERRGGRIETPWGAVAVKVGLWDGRPLKVSPEYEACRALAESSGAPLTEIYAAALEAIRQAYPEPGRSGKESS